MEFKRENYNRKKWREISLAIKHKLPYQNIFIMSLMETAEEMHRYRVDAQLRNREELNMSFEEYQEGLLEYKPLIVRKEEKFR